MKKNLLFETYQGQLENLTERLSEQIELPESEFDCIQASKLANAVGKYVINIMDLDLEGEGNNAKRNSDLVPAPEVLQERVVSIDLDFSPQVTDALIERLLAKNRGGEFERVCMKAKHQLNLLRKEGDAAYDWDQERRASIERAFRQIMEGREV